MVFLSRAGPPPFFWNSPISNAVLTRSNPYPGMLTQRSRGRERTPADFVTGSIETISNVSVRVTSGSLSRRSVPSRMMLTRSLLDHSGTSSWDASNRGASGAGVPSGIGVPTPTGSGGRSDGDVTHAVIIRTSKMRFVTSPDDR